MTYNYLGDTVQGLMDYTFYPFSAKVASFSFEVDHAVWGNIGTGTLTTAQPIKGGSAAAATA